MSLTVPLAGGVRMPMLGYGCCCRPGVTGPSFEHTLRTYLDAGGRLIDTAAGYFNHPEVGRAATKFLGAKGLPRDDLFITSKVAYPYGGHDTTAMGVDTVLHDLNMDHVDLLLLHHPQCARDAKPGVPGPACHASPRPKNCLEGAELKLCLQRSWDALVEAQRAGKARAIGVANFNAEQIGWLLEGGRPAPAVNQIAYNPLVPSSVHALVRWCQARSIAVTAFWSLNGHNGLAAKSSGGNNVVERLANKYSRSHAQILLRWALDRNVSVIPGSGKEQHIRANLAVTDFRLTTEEGVALEQAEKRQVVGGKLSKAVDKWGT